MKEGNAYQVLLFYKYVTVEDPEVLAASLLQLAEKYKLMGRGIVAAEGVNATFEGKTEDTEAFIAEFLHDERFKDMQVKRSAGTGASFKKLSVKVRDEIVGTRFSKEEANPEAKTAPRLSPEELRAWYERGEDFVVVDMRNDYEYRSGHFKDSVNPGLENSRDLPHALPKLAPLKNKKVLTVCTGGVRCEKMSAYLLSNGFKDVYQLENGIHGYMEKYPGKDFLGTLYTFDERVTMDFGGERQVIGTCMLCSIPTERYVNCGNDLCHLHFLACEACSSPEGRAYCKPECMQIAASGYTQRHIPA